MKTAKNVQVPSPIADPAIPTRVSSSTWLAIIVGLAVLLRVAVALVMGDRVYELPGIFDQLSYDTLAQQLLAGKGYSFSSEWYPFTPANTPTAHWSFIYPVYLAAVYGVAGYHPLAARILQAIFVGVSTCILVFWLTNRLFGSIVGLIAAAMAAVYPYFVYYSASLMTESLFMVCALASLEASYRLAERPTLGKAILLGLVLGLAILLRQTMLAFVPVLLLWLIWRGRRKIRWWQVAVPISVVLLLVIPWTTRNYRVYGHFLLLNSNAGYALYSSNHPNLGTEWQPDKSVNPIPNEWQSLNEAQLDRKLLQAGTGFVLDDPGRYALLTASKFKEYFKFWPSPGSSLVSNIQRPLSVGLLLPLALVGLYLGRHRLELASLLLLFVAVVAVLHLLTWPTARYRVPTDACLMPYAALTVFSVYTRLRPGETSTSD